MLQKRMKRAFLSAAATSICPLLTALLFATMPTTCPPRRPNAVMVLRARCGWISLRQVPLVQKLDLAFQGLPLRLVFKHAADRLIRTHLGAAQVSHQPFTLASIRTFLCA